MRKLTPVESRIVEVLRNGTPMRYAELRRLAAGNRSIKTLVDDGILLKLPMGLYSLDEPDRDDTHESIVALCLKRPDAVICFDSAAQYHGLTTDNPDYLFAAFPYASSPPKVMDLNLRASRWNERSLTVGVETVEIGPATVQITNEARTVLDLFRFAGRRGSDAAALEALRTFAERRSVGEINRMAREFDYEDQLADRLQTAQAFKGAR
jgi:predicted transcriptional regulator of viral defense system